MIFDRTQVLINRDRAAACMIGLEFYTNACDDLLERLSLIDKNYAKVLDLGCRSGILTTQLKKLYVDTEIIATDISQLMLDCFEHNKKFAIDEENIASSLLKLAPHFTSKYFNLISYSLGLHKINDVQNFLMSVNFLLKDDGIFIGNFIGGESLKNLRFTIFDAESSLRLPHHPHIPPFIHFDQVAMLLQNAGFAEIIVDYQNIDLEFASPLSLMHALKNVGESNTLFNRANYSLPKSVYSILQADNSSKFTDRLQLISFVASKKKNTIKLKSSNS